MRTTLMVVCTAWLVACGVGSTTPAGDGQGSSVAGTAGVPLGGGASAVPGSGGQPLAMPVTPSSGGAGGGQTLSMGGVGSGGTNPDPMPAGSGGLHVVHDHCVHGYEPEPSDET